MRPLPVLAAILVALPSVGAHGDRGVIDRGTRVDLAPGEDASWAFAGHYHRLVGRAEIETGGALVLGVVREDSGEALWTSERIEGARGVNALLLCCDGVTWANLRLVARSVADAPTRGTLSFEAVHDDFYVAGEGKEGDVFVTPLLFAIAPALLARGGWRAWRDLRPAAPPRRAIVLGAVSAAAALALAILAGSWGAARYGGTRIEGFLATAGVLSPFWGSVTAFAILLALWTAGLVFWVRAYRGALSGRGAGAVALLGTAQAAPLAVLPFAFGATYGSPTFVLTAASLWPTACAQLILVGLLARRFR